MGAPPSASPKAQYELAAYPTPRNQKKYLAKDNAWLNPPPKPLPAWPIIRRRSSSQGITRSASRTSNPGILG